MRLFLSFTVIIACASLAYSQQMPAGSARTVAVTAAEVKKGVSQPTLDVTGSAFFTTTADVAAESASKVAAVYVKDGDTVKAGQPLAKLDDSMLTYEIASAESKTKQATLNLEKTKRDHARNKSLYTQNSISQQKYQDSLTDYENADHAYQSALAEEKRLKTEKEKMTVRSPINGVVTNAAAKVGEWMPVGGTVASVASLTFEARVYLPEKVLPYVKPGQKVTVLTPWKELAGTVVSVNPKGDSSTRLFLAKIDIGSDPSFKEGIQTVVRIPSGPNVEALFVPRDGITETNSEKGVYKIENDTAIFAPVKVVGYSGGEIGVESDWLKPGDIIVIKGNNRVSNGSKVAVTAESK